MWAMLLQVALPPYNAVRCALSTRPRMSYRRPPSVKVSVADSPEFCIPSPIPLFFAVSPLFASAALLWQAGVRQLRRALHADPPQPGRAHQGTHRAAHQRDHRYRGDGMEGRALRATAWVVSPTSLAQRHLAEARAVLPFGQEWEARCRCAASHSLVQYAPWHAAATSQCCTLRNAHRLTHRFHRGRGTLSLVLGCVLCCECRARVHRFCML